MLLALSVQIGNQGKSVQSILYLAYLAHRKILLVYALKALFLLLTKKCFFASRIADFQAFAFPCLVVI